MADLHFAIPELPAQAAPSSSGAPGDASSSSSQPNAFSRKTAADVRAERAKTFLADGTALSVIDRHLTAVFVGQPQDPVGYLIRQLTESSELQQQQQQEQGKTGVAVSSPTTMAAPSAGLQILAMDADARKQQLDNVSESAQTYARRHKLAFLIDEMLAAILLSQRKTGDNRTVKTETYRRITLVRGTSAATRP